MPAQVVILHGWSDTHTSFLPLRAFLEAQGYSAIEVWLSDYISLDDDVRVPDIAKRMHAVIDTALAAGQLTKPFDIIAHSTGGLVAREWLSRFHPDPAAAPVKRIVMLSPANFGSKLAADGKSLIGRVLKGWNNWLQSGQQMLDELELASGYQWELACRDLLNPTNDEAPALYGKGRVWPFVISGTHGYTQGLQPIVNENGSDGTVRPAAANLNAIGMTVDFSRDGNDPNVRIWPSRTNGDIPFAILPDRNHGNINQPDLDTGSTASPQLAQLLLEALGCESDDAYATIAESWNDLTERTAALAEDPAALAAMFPTSPPAAATFHQFMQLFVRVTDDDGDPVDDFFPEFFSPDTEGDADTVTFHTEVLADVHTNSLDASMRCLFLDRTNLFEKYYAQLPPGLPKQVALSLSAAPPGADVRYFSNTAVGSEGDLLIHAQDVDARAALPARFHRNVTHLVEIIIPRRPMDDVFTISQPA